MQIQAHEEHEGEQMFAPLIRHIEKYCSDESKASHALENYLYMQHDSHGTYYYRHFWTRKYVLIDKDSGDVIVGEVDYSDYRENNEILH